MNIIYFWLVGAFLYLSTSFFVVSIEPVLLLIHYGFAFLFFIIFSPFIVRFRFLDKGFFEILSFYYIAVILSVIFGFIFVYIFNDNMFALGGVSMYGRIANIILFSLSSWFIVSLVCRYSDIFSLQKVITFYAVGCFLLILTGYWQAISLYLGVGSFPFETRSVVHGVNKMDYDIEGRLTGVAAEPSYFVPFILDFMILSLLVFKKNIIRATFFLIAILIMFLSFSPSGYVSMVGAFLLALIFVAKFKSKRYLYLLLSLISFSIIFLISVSDKIENIGYVVGRLENISDDVRFKTISDIFLIFSGTNVFTILFGYGLTNFKFASRFSDYSYFETSNNLYFDILIEMGVVGFSLILLLFFKVFLVIKRSTVCMYQKFVCYALFFDLLITGMVRADYASSRFFIMLAIIYLLSKIDTVSEKKYGK